MISKNEFNFFKWGACIITSSEKLAEQFEALNLKGKCIREIWNIGIIFDEEYHDGLMTVELDEPIIFIFDNYRLEVLFIDGSTVGIATNMLTLKETSYQGIECGKRTEKYLSTILNLPIAEVIFKFESGYRLHISAFYDYMHICIKDTEGEIPCLEL